jgi:hypothetical protein
MNWLGDKQADGETIIHMCNTSRQQDNAHLALNMLLAANLDEYFIPFKMMEDHGSLLTLNMFAFNFHYLIGPIYFLDLLYFTVGLACLLSTAQLLLFSRANASHGCTWLVAGFGGCMHACVGIFKRLASCI